MIFCTYWYVVAATAFFAVYLLLINRAFRYVGLLIFCLIFHTHFAGPAGVLPIIILATIVYLAGRSRNARLCEIAIATCVSALCFYKYTHFLCLEILGGVMPVAGKQLDAAAVALLPAVPPLAISFFTFEFVHYLYEVRRGEKPIKSIGDFAQFTFFFPSLVAGPIKRYQQFLPSMQSGLQNVNSKDISEGLLRICVGFFKKIVISDNLCLYIDYIEPSLNTVDHLQRWIFLFALALRIYLDFSGYSDIAIGVAQTLGVKLPRNFNWPYLARDIKDFWQRWHISLSSWIRDYVYIQLGGNRHGVLRTATNGLLAFALCGLWHGPAWNFIVWGLYHGSGLAICSTYRNWTGSAGVIVSSTFERVPVLSWFATLMFVCFGWLLFFYPVERALQITKLLF